MLKKAIIVMLLVLALGLCCAPAQANRLLTLGFELNSLTAGVETDRLVVGSGTGCSITTSPVYSGTYAFKCINPVDTSVYSAALPAAAAGRTYYTRIWLCVTTAPSVSTPILYGTDAAPNLGWRLDLGTDRTVALKTFGGGVAIGSASSALTLGTWYYVEVAYTYTGGTTTAKLNGTQFATGTGESSAALSLFAFGANSAFTGEYEIDDIAVNDDQGSYQNTYPGNSKVIYLRPSGAGDAAQWARAGTDSGANWSQCNNVPPNDVTSYVQVSTVNYADLYKFTASGIGASDTVNVVEVGGRIANSHATGSTMKFEIEKAASGTKAQSAAILPNSTTWRTNIAGTWAAGTPITSPIILYKDPDGTLVWTQATLDTLQAGVIETVDTTYYVQLSDIWVIVDYTPLSSITAVLSGLLSQVTASLSGSTVAGVLGGNLSKITSALTGSTVSGTIGATLAQVSATLSGAVDGISASLSGMLSQITAALTGSHGVTATVGASLSQITAALTGNSIYATLSGTLTQVNSDLSGAVDGITASLSGALSQVTAALAGSHGVAATISSTLSQVTAGLSGSSIVSTLSGTLTQVSASLSGSSIMATLSGLLTQVDASFTGAIVNFEAQLSGVLTQVSAALSGSSVSATMSVTLSQITAALDGDIQGVVIQITAVLAADLEQVQAALSGSSVVAMLNSSVASVSAGLSGAITNFQATLGATLSQISADLSGSSLVSSLTSICQPVITAFSGARGIGASLSATVSPVLASLTGTLGQMVQAVLNTATAAVQASVNAGHGVAARLEGVLEAIFIRFSSWFFGMPPYQNVLHIPAENRLLTMITENRSLALLRENRSLPITAESRWLSLPSESRILAIPAH